MTDWKAEAERLAEALKRIKKHAIISYDTAKHGNTIEASLSLVYIELEADRVLEHFQALKDKAGD